MSTDIRDAIYDAGLKRIRPCVMTTMTTLALLPVWLSTGRGADVARAMALPVFGGMLIEPFTTFIVPALYSAYMEFKMRAGLRDSFFQNGENPTAIEGETEMIAA
jgi:copper/silver efflux system protein